VHDVGPAGAPRDPSAATAVRDGTATGEAQRATVDAQAQGAIRRMQQANESLTAQALHAQLPPSSLRPIRAPETAASERRDATTPRLGLLGARPTTPRVLQAR
jgi:hypothetical protein